MPEFNDSSESFKLYTAMVERARASGHMPADDHASSSGYYKALWDLAYGAIFGSAADLLVFAHMLVEKSEYAGLIEHYACEAATALETAAALAGDA